MGFNSGFKGLSQWWCGCIYIGSVLVDVCMFQSRTVRHTHINKDTTNICSHITTDLIIQWWTITDYFYTV